MSDPPRMRSMFGGETDGGFFGIPRADVGDLQGADIVIVGAPCATPYKSVGAYCASAPAAIRNAFGWPGVLEHHDFDIGGKLLPAGISAVDWGDLGWEESDAAGNRARITAAVASVLEAGAVPIVLGGDDSIPIPVLQAWQRHQPVCVLQLDAHIDWRNEVGGERMGLSSTMRRASEMKWVDHIVQVGARGLGSARPTDYEDARTWGVEFITMRDFRRGGVAAVVEAIPDNEDVFITLDVDAMDPAVMPSVIGPAPGGLSYWDVIEMIEAVAGKNRIAGFDIVELMPDADSGGRGALVAARVVAMTLGLIARQRASDSQRI